MPWFYFHLRTPQDLEPDDTGLEFAGIEAAYLEACASIPEISDGLACERKNSARYAFEIADPAGRPLMEVPFTGDPGPRAKTQCVTIPGSASEEMAEMKRTVRLISSMGGERVTRAEPSAQAAVRRFVLAATCSQ